MKNLRMTDLVDEYILQELQDLFITKINMIVMVVDADGEDITKCRNACEFCKDYTKSTKEGKLRCDNCDRDGAKRAQEAGDAITYTCHAGLTDFCSPIIIEGHLYGYIVGGQVRTGELDKEAVYRLAEEIGVDKEGYWQAACKVKLIGQKELDMAVEQLRTITRIITDVAMNKYYVLKSNVEIQSEAKMKSDFLANMSHEIRTPMNAVIGMADMALREELPDNARKYISQIKSSGKTLLTIINDILDVSKIESGKMEITLGDYSTPRMIEELTNIIVTRIGNKPVELIIDVDKNLPMSLMGDEVRIKQIITNLAGNAVKFTREGEVKLSFSSSKKDDKIYMLSVSVKDTGIGIKEKDLKRIFDSFQQVDSKRNRNIEGTGLGLAISERLVGLMDGELKVKSTYGVGSEFYFEIPQYVLRDVKTIEVNEAETICVAIYVGNQYVSDQLCKDICSLGVKFYTISEVEQIHAQVTDYIIIDEEMFDEEVTRFLCHHNNITGVVLTGMNSSVVSAMENVIILRKPVYLNLLANLFNKQDIRTADLFEDKNEVVIDFVAPEAKVLVVDDNEVNLGVAVGLLEPLKMKVDTAESGMETMEKIKKTHYDLIFMDHMMPQMDGVETTKLIRKFHHEYDNVPIVALTANVMEESKSMFLVEGMNDFLAKPIEFSAMIEVVKRLLPEELKQYAKEIYSAGEDSENDELMNIPELDIGLALENLGSKRVLRNAIENYYKIIGKKAKAIKKNAENMDFKNFTIEVHSLKSASKQIGATKLGNMAEKLEKAGNAGDRETIIKDTPWLIVEYLQLQRTLSKFFKEEKEVEKPGIDPEQLADNLNNLMDAVSELDMDGMEQAISDMDKYSYAGEEKELFNKLKEAVDNLDVDTCEETINSWKKIIHI